MSQNLSSSAVVIDAFNVKSTITLMISLFISLKYFNIMTCIWALKCVVYNNPPVLAISCKYSWTRFHSENIVHNQSYGENLQ